MPYIYDSFNFFEIQASTTLYEKKKQTNSNSVRFFSTFYPKAHLELFLGEDKVILIRTLIRHKGYGII